MECIPWSPIAADAAWYRSQPTQTRAVIRLDTLSKRERRIAAPPAKPVEIEPAGPTMECQFRH